MNIETTSAVAPSRDKVKVFSGRSAGLLRNDGFNHMRSDFVLVSFARAGANVISKSPHHQRESIEHRARLRSEKITNCRSAFSANDSAVQSSSGSIQDFFSILR
jgi:hypothetical protein